MRSPRKYLSSLSQSTPPNSVSIYIFKNNTEVYFLHTSSSGLIGKLLSVIGTLSFHPTGLPCSKVTSIFESKKAATAPAIISTPPAGVARRKEEGEMLKPLFLLLFLI